MNEMNFLRNIKKSNINKALSESIFYYFMDYTLWTMIILWTKVSKSLLEVIYIWRKCHDCLKNLNTKET
jgi:hypothetical protein